MILPNWLGVRFKFIFKRKKREKKRGLIPTKEQLQMEKCP